MRSPAANAGHRRRTSVAVDPLVRHADGVEARRVRRRHRSRRPREEVDAAGAGDDRLAGLAFDGRPGVVRTGAQLDVPGRVIRAADDPRVVVRRPAHMPELELLEPDDVDTPAREPVGRRRAETTEPDHPDRTISTIRPVSHRRARRRRRRRTCVAPRRRIPIWRPSPRRTTARCRPTRPPSGANVPPVQARDDMPRCTLSQIDQSWRFVATATWSAEAIERLNRYLRNDSVIGRRLFELCAIIGAWEIEQQYEWSGHEPAALQFGVSQKAVDTSSSTARSKACPKTKQSSFRWAARSCASTGSTPKSTRTPSSCSDDKARWSCPSPWGTM